MAKQTRSSSPVAAKGPASAPLPRQAFNLARQVFLNLIKYARTQRLYGTGHSHSARFRELYFQSCVQFLETYGWLNVDVDNDAIRFGDQVLLGADSMGEDMAIALYGEGVRNISVEKGASTRELDQLAELLVARWSDRGDFEEDLVSMVWRADFEHVHVDIADRFSTASELGQDALRADAESGWGSDARDAVGEGDSVQLRELQALLEDLRTERMSDQSVVSMTQDEAALFARLKDDLAGGENDPLARQDNEPELIQVDPMQSKAVVEEVERINRGADADFEQMGRLMFEMVRLEGSFAAQELGELTAKQVIALLRRGQLQEAGMLVRRTQALREQDLFPDAGDGDPFAKGYAQLLDEHNQDTVAFTLERVTPDRRSRGALFSLLMPLAHESLPQLGQLCPKLKAPDLRQVVGDIYLARLGSDPEQVLEQLDAAKGAAAAAPLLALSRFSLPKAIGACMARVHAPEARVREAALRALRGQQSPGVKDAMVSALSDTDSGVRTEALRYLAVYRDPTCAKSIAARMTHPDFADVNPKELRAWMLAYALVGRGEALSLLRKVALGTETLPGEHATAKELAAEAILRIGTQASRATLNELARKDDKLADHLRSVRPGGSS